MTKNMILFDFDGVLIDSSAEAGLNAYNVLTDQLIVDLAAIPEEYNSLFAANRPVARKAHEIVGVGRWCLKQLESTESIPPNLLLDRQQLQQELTELNLSSGEIEGKFFNTRMKMIEKDRVAWLNIHRTYAPLIDLIKERGQPITILTSKNRAAVLELSEHFKIPTKADLIFSGDNFCSKSDNLKRIKANFPGKEFAFLDDCLENLIEVGQADPDVALWLADWGYVEREQLGPSSNQSKHPKVTTLSITEVIKLVEERT